MRGFEASGPVHSGTDAIASATRGASQLEGQLKIADLVLTVIAFPFFVVSTVGLFLFVKRWGRMSVIDWVFGALVGLFLVPFILSVFDVPGGAVRWIVGISFGAWTVRGALRWYGKVKEFERFT